MSDQFHGHLHITIGVDEGLRTLFTNLFDNSKIERQLTYVLRGLEKIMKSQEEFDTQITEANAKLDDLGTAVTAETDQIKAFIEANPSINTSGLDGVVSRLEGVASSVGTIFEPTVPVTPGTPVNETA